MYLLNLDVLGNEQVVTPVFTFHYVSIKSGVRQWKDSGYDEFTFHYVSIKSKADTYNDEELGLFTFHYVSIKSKFPLFTSCHPDIFTFHYVSIKSARSRTSILIGHHLHSTMYLLNRQTRIYTCRRCHNLHSTMYLLNLVTVCEKPLDRLIYIPLCIY